MSNNTVTFKVAGNEVMSFIDKVKSKNDELTNKMISDAKRQADSGKDQLKIIDDQIKALQRKSKIESDAARNVALTEHRSALSSNEQYYNERRDKLLSQKGKLGDEKYQSHLDTLNSQEKGDAQSLGKDYKDKLGGIREDEKQAVMQTKLLKDNVEAVKQSSNIQALQLHKNNGELVDELDKNATPMEQMAREMAMQKYNEDKEDKNGKRGSGPGLFAELLGVEQLNKLLGAASQFASTKNGFDLIKPASQGIGQLAGGLLGGILGSLIAPGVGTMAGVAIGSDIGGTIGGGVGEFEQRKGIAGQDFLKAKFAYEAQSQNAMPDLPDQSGIGVSAAEYLATMKQIAASTASTTRAVENTSDVLEMEKGVGVSAQTSNQFLTLFRGTQKDISNLVGGVMERGKDSMFSGGKDYTFLNELLSKMATLQSTMQQTTDKVSTGTTFDIINKFNNLGGAFRATDPRSSGLIGQIQNSLVNPGSDATNAMSMLALRRANPHMGIADLMMEREKGLSSPTYLKSMLKSLDSYGGGEQFERMNIAGTFGINQAAAKRLYDHRKELESGKMNTDSIEDMYSKDFKGEASNRTTAIDKNTASIANGLLGDWKMTLDKMQESFKVAMEDTFNGATIEMVNGKIKFAPGRAKQNVVKSGVASASESQMKGAPIASAGAAYTSGMSF